MSKELIERLRADAESTDDIGLCADAADRIEELERKVASRDAEVAKLKDDNEYLYVAAIERDQLRAELAAEQANNARLRDFIANAQVSSGVCCCGEAMDGHSSPMSCGHSPVDMWDHAVEKLLHAPSDTSTPRAVPCRVPEQGDRSVCK